MSTASAAQERRWLIEAAAWRTHLTETGAHSSEDFEAWLTDPGCARAWQQVQQSGEIVAVHADSPRMLEIRRAAMRNLRAAGHEQDRRSIAHGWRKVAAAAVIVMTVGAGLVSWRLTAPDVYRTTTGEIRVVTLEDGSRVALDSQSELRVQYSAWARDLQLRRGQARFEVAHDIERPFAVTVNGQKVIATGTQFNIDVLSSQVFITLISGSVAVLPAERAERDQAAIKMWAAGEQLVVSSKAPPYLVNVEVERTTAWQAGRLVFDDESLASVVERVSRYARRPVRIGDEAVGKLRISGVFRAGDVDGFVDTITSYVGVRAERGREGEILLRHRS